MANTRIAHPEHRRAYVAWCSMKSRCYYEANKGFANYGGRGITVCDRWRDSFANFLADMGDPPGGRTLDRVNNDGDYEPSNCRWATHAEQANNRRPFRMRSRERVLAHPAVIDLDARRARAGFSTAMLAQEAGSNETTFSRWRNGKQSPNVETLKRWNLALDRLVARAVEERGLLAKYGR